MTKNFLFPDETANSRLPPNYNTNWPPSQWLGIPKTCYFLKCALGRNLTSLAAARSLTTLGFE